MSSNSKRALEINICRYELMLACGDHSRQCDREEWLNYMRELVKEWMPLQGFYVQQLEKINKDLERAHKITGNPTPGDAEWVWLFSHFNVRINWADIAVLKTKKTIYLGRMSREFTNTSRSLFVQHTPHLYSGYSLGFGSGYKMLIGEDDLLKRACLGLGYDTMDGTTDREFEIFARVRKLGIITRSEAESRPEEVADFHARENADVIEDWLQMEQHEEKVKKLRRLLKSAELHKKAAEENYQLMLAHVKASGGTEELLLAAYKLLPKTGEQYKAAQESFNERQLGKRKAEDAAVEESSEKEAKTE